MFFVLALDLSENDLGNAVAATEAADIVFMKFRRFKINLVIENLTQALN